MADRFLSSAAPIAAAYFESERDIYLRDRVMQIVERHVQLWLKNKFIFCKTCQFHTSRIALTSVLNREIAILSTLSNQLARWRGYIANKH